MMDNPGKEMQDIPPYTIPDPAAPPQYQSQPATQPYDSQPAYPGQPTQPYAPQPTQPYAPQPTQSYASQPAPYPGQPVMQQPQSQPPMPYQTQQTTNTNTTVVIQQQAPQIIIQGPQGWSTGVLDCCSDMGICCLGMMCPCVLPAVVSCKANECCCVGWMYPVALRAAIRERYNIKGGVCNDACTMFCVGYTPVFCQMARELKNQGAW